MCARGGLTSDMQCFFKTQKIDLKIKIVQILDLQFNIVLKKMKKKTYVPIGNKKH